MKKENKTNKPLVKPEKLSVNKINPVDEEPDEGLAAPGRDDEEEILDPEDEAPGEYDLTKDDLEALGDPELSQDLGDDEKLKHQDLPIDFAAEDLDVPGSENDDDSERIGEEDEENNAYSIGGDNHDDLDETDSENEDQIIY